MDRKIQTAVIGLGAMGQVHAEWSYQLRDAELCAVCDIQIDVAKNIAQKYNIDYYTDYHKLLEDKNIDAVFITVPNFLHAQVAIEAAKMGKHVAIEKPLCTNLKDADTMIQAIKNAGVFDQYCENLCFAPACTKAKEVIDEGGIGDVHMIRCREALKFFGFDFPRWNVEYDKAGGGAMLTTGIHPIGYVRYLLNKAPAVKVYCEMIHLDNVVSEDERVEDVATAIVRYKGGQIGVIDTSYCASSGVDDIAEIYGNEGTIFIDLCRRNPIYVHSNRGYTISKWFAVPGLDQNWSFPVPDEMHTYGYWHEQQHFIHSILTDKRPKFNFDDGRAALEVALAARKSYQEGKVITLQ
ncbi:Gfo/Idh/MocA family protein [[Eubacterium] cellulosolvens]